MQDFTPGECRYSSAGNVYRLEWYDGRHCGVRRIQAGERTGEALWDSDVIYRWIPCQWESLPLIGETSDEPTFGLFAPIQSV